MSLSKRLKVHLIDEDDFSILKDWEGALLIAVLREQPEIAKGLPIKCRQDDLAEVTHFPLWKIKALLKALKMAGAIEVKIIGLGKERMSSIKVLAQKVTQEQTAEKEQLVLCREFVADEEKKEQAILDAFDVCWKIYPKKAGKSYALKSFRKAIDKGAEPGAIIAALEKQEVKWRNTAMQYIPHFSTWLNQERYEDYGEHLEKYRGKKDRDEFEMMF